MTHAAFRKRCRALGVDNAHAAAVRIGLPPSSMSRIWSGERAVSKRTVAKLEAAEAAQPVRPLTPLVARVLLTEWQGTVSVPSESNFDRGYPWGEVLDEMERLGLFHSPPYGVAPWRLSADGMRCVAFLQRPR